MAGRSRGTSRCGQRMAHGNGAAESERPQNNPGAGPARLPSTDSRCPWRLLRLLQPVWDPPPPLPPLPPPAWWRDCPGWGGYGVVEAEAAVGGVWEVLKVVAGGGDLTDFAEAVAKALQHSVCASGRYRVSSDLRQRFGRGRRRLCRDLVGGLRPDEEPGSVVPVGRPGPNVAFEGLDGAVDSTLELLLRELGEPPLHQVQPRGSRRLKCRWKRGAKRVMVVPTGCGRGCGVRERPASSAGPVGTGPGPRSATSRPCRGPKPSPAGSGRGRARRGPCRCTVDPSTA